MRPFSTAAAAISRISQLHRWDRRFRRQVGDVSRITVVSQFFPPDFAATGQLLDQLTTGLAGDGMQIQVLSGMPAYAYNRHEAEPVAFEPNRVIFRTRASRFWPKRIRGRAVNGLLFCLRTSLRLLKYARRGDLIVYTTEPPYLPVVGWLVHQLTRTPLLRTTPYVLLLYDLYPDVLAELGILHDRHWLMRIWRQLNRYAFGAARDLIVLNEAMRRRVAFFNPAVTGRIHVIPSWADTDAIQPLIKTRNWFVQRYALAESFNVLYSGNQGRCHDLVTLMAAAMLLRQRADIRFVFIGAGPQHQRIRDLAADWGLGNVLFLPYQDLDVLPFSLTCADLALVSLGLHAEGLVAPSKIYGHLAAGTPLAVVAPPDSELRALVAEDLGRCFDNADAAGLAEYITQLAADPSQVLSVGAHCRATAVARFGRQTALAAYRAVLCGSSPASEEPVGVSHPLP
ncbi:MAG: glycosyltransferase family 4 protein [Cyanobium sp.]|nr:glycosyltransferase family 4 protein [Cyanobium sp.]